MEILNVILMVVSIAVAIIVAIILHRQSKEIASLGAQVGLQIKKILMNCYKYWTISNLKSC